uniref:Protein kish-B n=1 Tax=Anas platyrhynchos TaxID=8839 RepID=A0A8B9TRB9_ANAPL
MRRALGAGAALRQGPGAAMTNVYSLDGLLVFGLLLVCTCAYLRKVPRLRAWLHGERRGLGGVCYKGEGGRDRDTGTPGHRGGMGTRVGDVARGMWGCDTGTRGCRGAFGGVGL